VQVQTIPNLKRLKKGGGDMWGVGGLDESRQTGEKGRVMGGQRIDIVNSRVIPGAVTLPSGGRERTEAHPSRL